VMVHAAHRGPRELARPKQNPIRSRRDKGFFSSLLVDKIIRKSPAPSRKGQQESSSFLKKRTKKLLLCWLTQRATLVRTVERKSFLVLFFKKELLPSSLLSFYCFTLQFDLVNNVGWAPNVGF